MADAMRQDGVDVHLGERRAAVRHLAPGHDLEPGEQVLWSYGERGNDDYFAYHGFVLPNNALDDVLLFQGGDGGGSEGGVEEAARWAAAALAEEEVDGDGGGEVDVGAVGALLVGCLFV